MKIVSYSPAGTPVPDLFAENYARQLRYPEVQSLHVSTENVILATRALISEGVLNHEEVQFKFCGQILKPDRSGRLEEWPRGFCDTSERFLMRLLSYKPKEETNGKIPRPTDPTIQAQAQDQPEGSSGGGGQA